MPSICPFQWSVFCSFSNWIPCFCFVLFYCWALNVLYCSDILATQYFSQKSSVGYMVCRYFLPVFNFFLFLKIFLIGSLGRKVFNFDEVQFIRFLFMGLVFGVKSENCRPSSVLWRFSVVLHLSLWSVWISFYVSYEIWVKVFFFPFVCFFFFFLPINLQVLQHHWLKRLSFLHWITFAPFSKSSWTEFCVILILGLYSVPLI